MCGSDHSDEEVDHIECIVHSSEELFRRQQAAIQSIADVFAFEVYEPSAPVDYDLT